MKIKHQLLLTHGLLVIMSFVIVIINVVAYSGLDNDAVLINQSGKMRALSYNMAQLANRICTETSDQELIQKKLQLRIEEFDSILVLLGQDRKTRIAHLETLSKVQRITSKWNEVFKPLFDGLLASKEKDENCTQINEKIDGFVDEIHEMVTSYSAFSKNKVFVALLINAGLVIVILLVTAYSFITTNIRIRRPMQLLMQELKELSLIDEEVSKRLHFINQDEISEMTHYFNEMMFDQLTKTFSRRAGLAKLSRMVQQENRRHEKFCLCFIDINGLKIVNDRLGHKYGDELIVRVVDIIKNKIRVDDFVIRMGGDEFLIVFCGIDTVAAEKVWLRIDQTYQSINEQEEKLYRLSVSHGIVLYDKYEKSELELYIKRADEIMYEEKQYIKRELHRNVIKADDKQI